MFLLSVADFCGVRSRPTRVCSHHLPAFCLPHSFVHLFSIHFISALASDCFAFYVVRLSVGFPNQSLHSDAEPVSLAVHTLLESTLSATNLVRFTHDTSAEYAPVFTAFATAHCPSCKTHRAPRLHQPLRTMPLLAGMVGEMKAYVYQRYGQH